jgi:hypothetical protein
MHVVSGSEWASWGFATMSEGPQGRLGKGGAKLRRLSRRDRDGSVGEIMEVWDGRREGVREGGKVSSIG